MDSMDKKNVGVAEKETLIEQLLMFPKGVCFHLISAFQN